MVVHLALWLDGEEYDSAPMHRGREVGQHGDADTVGFATEPPEDLVDALAG